MNVLKEKDEAQVNTLKMTHTIDTATDTEGPARKKVKGEASQPMCHQCHQPRETVVRCTRKQLKGKVCGKAFCDGCLLRVYGEKPNNLPTVQDASFHDTNGAMWSCPVCDDKCVCSPCRQKKGLVPTGNVKGYADKMGITPVEVFKSEKLIQEAIQWRIDNPSAAKRRQSALGIQAVEMAKDSTPAKASQPVMQALDAQQFSFFTKPAARTTIREFKEYQPPKPKGKKAAQNGSENTKPTTKKSSAPSGSGASKNSKDTSSTTVAAPKPKALTKLAINAENSAASGSNAKSMMSSFSITPRQRSIQVLLPSPGASKTMSQATLNSFFLSPALPRPATVNGGGPTPMLMAPVTVQKLTAITPPAPPPPPAKVSPPEFEKLQVDIDDDLLERRLEIRAGYFKFKRTAKTLVAHANELSNANGKWTALIYKKLAMMYLKHMQNDFRSKLWDVDELYEFIRAHENDAADSEKFWSAIHDYFDDLSGKDEFSYDGEETWARIVRYLQQMFFQTSVAKKQLADDAELAKAKHKDYINARNKLMEEKKTLTGEALEIYRAKLGYLEFEDWYVQRVLASRLPHILGKDDLGNEYHFSIQETWQEDNWGHWVIIKKAEGLLHPSGVAKEDCDPDHTWYTLYTSDQLNHLQNYILYQAWVNRNTAAVNEELRTFAHQAGKLASFYRAEEECARLKVKIEPELSKNI